MARNNWSKEEHILAFNLYCKIPFTKINANYFPVKELANILNRSNGSVAMKLANFARLDPTLKARNIAGLTQGAKGEEEVWNEFNGNWDDLVWQSEQVLAKFKGDSVENITEISKEFLPREGREREIVIRARVNQSFFRKTVLASYNNTCCVTGLSIPELLVAGHIIPWSDDIKNRMNPSNGLAMNALHDRAFDCGLMTITPDYIIHLSPKILDKIKKDSTERFLIPYEGKKIILPQKFTPLREFFEYHNTRIFKT